MLKRIITTGFWVVLWTIAGLQQAGAWCNQGPFALTVDGEIRESAQVYLPNKYDAANPIKKWPLVLLLHGYGASGSLQDYYFGLSTKVSSREFILVIAEGTEDSKGKKFWNATRACCDFESKEPDDISYLIDVVERAKSQYNIDARKVYIIGHSNGAFMAHRLACESSPLFAGIVSFAGAAHHDAGECNPYEPVSVLQIHAEDDPTIRYAGGKLEGFDYPGAVESVAQWRTNNGCDESFEDGEPLRLIRFVPGDDTTTRTWSRCQNESKVALWTIASYSGYFHNPHTPWFKNEATERILDFLLAQSKPRTKRSVAIRDPS